MSAADELTVDPLQQCFWVYEDVVGGQHDDLPAEVRKPFAGGDVVAPLSLLRAMQVAVVLDRDSLSAILQVRSGPMVRGGTGR
jgi:hypothetical protein